MGLIFISNSIYKENPKFSNLHQIRQIWNNLNRNKNDSTLHSSKQQRSTMKSFFSFFRSYSRLQNSGSLFFFSPSVAYMVIALVVVVVAAAIFAAATKAVTFIDIVNVVP